MNWKTVTVVFTEHLDKDYEVRIDVKARNRREAIDKAYEKIRHTHDYVILAWECPQCGDYTWHAWIDGQPF